ncbi:uncharacterized protein LOC129763514 [Toxorhynchites rutilus septentrionalis]|uniref:uncharacterized protein LOC129763514 n=1 Tax=Toxorhynchites rutilus septentrionalis TaxID=329112 RepID=UPI002478651D|nr:uncharacterized protein LOC129763514 [Toxorhynchites rutilus septentrionalis]
MSLFYRSVLLLATIDSLQSLPNYDVMFEKIEQLNGTDLIEFNNIRVRKFNRTVSVLDGNIELRAEANDKYVISIRSAYSSKGNNQFNEYPMKLPPQRICEFFNTTWREYYPYYNETTNFPEVGECPITPKMFYVKNHILDGSVFPPYIPKGLWRLSVFGRLVDADEVLICVDVYIKVVDKGIF